MKINCFIEYIYPLSPLISTVSLCMCFRSESGFADGVSDAGGPAVAKAP